jgi:hypothetical protein
MIPALAETEMVMVTVRLTMVIHQALHRMPMELGALVRFWVYQIQAVLKHGLSYF